jgi:hypothetical protein
MIPMRNAVISDSVAIAKIVGMRLLVAQKDRALARWGGALA